jgi:hypothetical protein
LLAVAAATGLDLLTRKQAEEGDGDGDGKGRGVEWVHLAAAHLEVRIQHPLVVEVEKERAVHQVVYLPAPVCLR